MHVRSLPAFAAALVVLFSAAPALAAWTGPTAAPPGGNVAAPINVGSVFQDKSGSVWFDGGVGINAGSGYCIGTSCITAWPTAGTNYWTLSSGNLSNNSGNYISATNNSLTWPANTLYIMPDLPAGSWNALVNAGDTLLMWRGTNIDTATQGFVLGPWSASAKGVRIDPSGNVGIGTASPAQKLDVAGNVNVSSGSCFMVNGTCLTTGGQWTTSGANIYNSNTGNVGIGTQSPLATLDVRPTANTNLVVYNNSDLGSNTAIISNVNDANTAFEPLEFAASKYNFGTGSVGIGTQAPHGLLDVAGIGVFSSSDSQLAAWSDSANAFVAIEGRNVANTIKRPLVLNAWGGNVGIGTASPSEKLEVYGNVKATAFIYSSDRRLKTDIHPLSNSLAAILQIKGVGFTWSAGNQKGKSDIGFIAQDVQKVVPEIVHTDASTTLESIDYARLTPLIVGAIQEQEQKIEAQQKEIDELKAQLHAISGR